MPGDYPPILENGQKVTYIDSDGDEHRALVVSTVPDADYITCVTGEQAEIGNGYNYSVESHSSVFPHPDEWDGDTATETNAYKTGWP
jgi:hypothetical protein